MAEYTTTIWTELIKGGVALAIAGLAYVGGKSERTPAPVPGPNPVATSSSLPVVSPPPADLQPELDKLSGEVASLRAQLAGQTWAAGYKTYTGGREKKDCVSSLTEQIQATGARVENSSEDTLSIMRSKNQIGFWCDSDKVIYIAFGANDPNSARDFAANIATTIYP